MWEGGGWPLAGAARTMMGKGGGAGRNDAGIGAALRLRMDTTKTALERAFELAETGQFRTNGELKTALAKEGYNASQVTGPQLLRQLRQIMADAQK